jgi:lysophospholipase L1-like esterase
VKTVVLFGDSNTWGYVPGGNGERWPREVRWPVQLGGLLGDGWEVIAEGLSGRTATIERPASEGRNGLPYLLPCLHSHAPVDVLVIFLGTNDIGYMSVEEVAGSIGRLVKVARHSEAGPDGASPRILVVAPPPFDGHAFSAAFEDVCGVLGCELIDLAGVTSYAVADLDTCHLDADGHGAVARAVAERLLA